MNDENKTWLQPGVPSGTDTGDTMPAASMPAKRPKRPRKSAARAKQNKRRALKKGKRRALKKGKRR